MLHLPAMRQPNWFVKLATVVIGLALLSASSAAPVRAQAEEPAAMPARLEGYLKLIEPGNWWVGDAHVIVNDQTVVIEKRGRAEVSAWVVVQGVQTPDGLIVAEFIVVERPAGRQGIIWPFSGILRKQAGTLWVIDDNLVRITPETLITGSPLPGWLVWVVAEQPSDSLEPVAIAIEAIAGDPTQVPVEFEGILESMEPEWRVEGQRFVLSPQALRLGELVIGHTVEVQATIQPDETLVAHLIRAVDTSADARLTAMVAEITTHANGKQVWDLLVFPPSPWDEPYLSTAHVGANTLVDESRAIAQAGQWAEIQGVTIGQAEVQADVIRLDQPVPVATSGELRQAGIAGASGWWTLDGTPVWTESARLSRLAGQVEGEVLVRGVRLGNGVLWAERITPVMATGR